MNGRSIGIAALFLRISTTKIQAYTNVCPHQSVNNRWSLEGNSFKCAQHGKSYGTDCDDTNALECYESNLDGDTLTIVIR